MNKRERLALYEFTSCPFCRRVRHFLASIGEQVESRDVTLDPGFRVELERETGNPMVPCLRIEASDGAVRWMHQSADIIEYLKDHFQKI